MPEDSVTIKVLCRIDEIDAAAWDACAGDGNPFLRHAFLDALEKSGSAAPESGWAPQHLVIEDDGQTVACAPLYLKSHSYGEYVFDWSWADAYERAGGRYYPKLQCAVPFTPATGPRLLTRPGTERARLVDLLIAGMLELARRHHVSSLHVTFPTEEEWTHLGDAGMLQRIGQQFHWENRGYASFDEFLAQLSSRKRKDIRKEREKANAQGLTIRTLTGSDITPAHWDAFHDFYLDTVGRKLAHAYLTRAFFDHLGTSMADKCVLVVAEENGRPVAGALNLIGGDTLYGRNWGASGDFPFLHFELCYYRAIDFAIERGLKWVEAGAQGQHKVSRGYLPRATYSAHWIKDDAFQAVVARFLGHEREMVAADMEETAEAGPFRRG